MIETPPKPSRQIVDQPPKRTSNVLDRPLPRFRSQSFERPSTVDAAAIRLSEAFTPTMPMQESDNFVGRREILQRIISAIEEDHAHVLIYGPRGIGKTSLTNVLAEAAQNANYHVYRFPCNSDSNYQDVCRGLFEHVPIEFMDRTARTRYPQVENFDQLLPSGEFGVHHTTEVLRLVELEHLLFVIDEFDRVKDHDLRRKLAETIKNISDVSARVTFIIVGVANRLEDLFGHHPSIERNVVGIQIPLLANEEVDALIGAGAIRAELKFDDQVRRMIITFAKGSPYYAQLLCLHGGRAALARGASSVGVDDLWMAIQSLLIEANPNVVAAYEAATRGERRLLFADVLYAASRCRTDAFGFFTAASVIESMQDTDSRDINELNVHKTLSELAGDSIDAIMDKQVTPAGTTRYKFRSPVMGQYVLIRQARLRGLV